MKALRTALKLIYDIEDQYLVPLEGDYFVPTINRDVPTATWIGYKILDKKPYVRAYQPDTHMTIPIRVKWRMSFIGPQAEELADQTLLWDVRTDVVRAFEEYEAQVNYTDRTIFTVPWRNEGFNDSLCWVVDMSAQTTYDIDTKQRRWRLQAPEPVCRDWLPCPVQKLQGNLTIGD